MNSDKGNRRTVTAILIVIVLVLVVILIVALVYRSGESSTSTSGCGNLAPPVGVVLIRQELVKLKVTWLPVSGAVRYRVYIGTIPGFNKASALESYISLEPEYLITGLVLGRSYYVKVVAINACGNEGQLSLETSTTLEFPDKFRIVSRAQPSLALRVAPDLTNVIVDAFCSGSPGDDSCVWSYDQLQSLLTISSSPGNCMKTLPAIIDSRVKYSSCGDTTYLNWPAARQWNYTSEVGTFCNPPNSEGNNCIKVIGSIVPGDFAVRVPYDGTLSMQWDIIEV